MKRMQRDCLERQSEKKLYLPTFLFFLSSFFCAGGRGRLTPHLLYPSDSSFPFLLYSCYIYFAPLSPPALFSRASLCGVAPRRKLTPLPDYLCGPTFNAMLQFKNDVDCEKCARALRGKLLCKGTLKTSIDDRDETNEELLFVAPSVSFDTRGYFSAAMTDYRERQARQAVSIAFCFVSFF